MVNKLYSSKKHIKTLGLMIRFCMVLANVNEFDKRCDDNRFNTGCNRLACHVHDGTNLS